MAGESEMIPTSLHPTVGGLARANESGEVEVWLSRLIILISLRGKGLVRVYSCVLRVGLIEGKADQFSSASGGQQGKAAHGNSLS